MCGIVGEVSHRQPPSEAGVRRMLGRIAHRGPDAEGLWASDCVLLGHRRLSVIDPTARSEQPMLSPCGRYSIVFNGEIYNFAEIRQSLEAKQERFETTGDTEVLLRLLSREGLDGLRRLNGMFAFALWDRQNQELWAARDRFGEKPFYYLEYPDHGGLLFASELQALIAHERASRTINPASLSCYLANNYVVGESAIVDGVKRLPPAHCLRWSLKAGLRIERYWDLARAFLAGKRRESAATLMEELRSLVDDAVKLRLVSDVPIGAFLSGGVDSSIVVSSVRKHRGAELTAYSIGFAESDFDEVPKARSAAEQLGVPLCDRQVRMDLLNDIETIAGAGDEPFADTSIVPTYYLSRFARENVTVALSGDGGDELFLGYETYLASRLRKMAGPMGKILGPVLNGMGRLVPTTHGKVSFDYKLRQFAGGLSKAPPAAHWFWRNIHDGHDRAALLRSRLGAGDAAAADGYAECERHLRSVAGASFLDQMSYLDIKTWLVDDVLHKVDRASMAHSLEVRAPFLDHRIAEFAAQLPVQFKLRGTSKKWLLKETFKSRFSKGFLDQPKAGFGSPVGLWLKGPLREMAGDLFHSSELSSILDPRVAQRLLAEHLSDKLDHGYRLFNLVILALWLRRLPVKLALS